MSEVPSYQEQVSTLYVRAALGRALRSIKLRDWHMAKVYVAQATADIDKVLKEDDAIGE